MNHWEAEAASWLAWTRTPGHDAYWRYRDAFFALVPGAGRATLEIGCGEGRVCRDLAARGHTVTGVDAAPTLLRAAAEAHPEGTYLDGDATALPFPDASFDLVVAYNSLMDVADMPAAVAEAARVLAPGGAFCVCVTHPFTDALQESVGPYLDGGVYEGTFTRDGLTMTFHGWTHPLSAYTAALEAAGLRVDALREPADPFDPDRSWPMFLMLRAS